ncbi:hypothetical protein A2U01_0070885, partial [Trifolium medium]|nr:hypothetical protein [Trifolium medium]
GRVAQCADSLQASLGFC